MTETEIKTEDKAWFTMLPNIVDDDDLDPYAFRLYVHLRRVAGDKGRCWQSTKTLAAHCKMSTGKISESKKALREKGLIIIEEKKKPNGQIYHSITIVDIWKKNMQHFTSSSDENTRSPDERAGSPDERKNIPSLRNPTTTPTADKKRPESEPACFQEWLDQIEESKNRQAVLVRMHKTLYPARDAPGFPYMAKVAKGMGASRLAQLMWELSTRPPVGDVLAYITAAEKGRKKRNGNSAYQRGNGRDNGSIEQVEIATGLGEYAADVCG